MSSDLINQTPDTIAAGVNIFIDAALEAAQNGDTERVRELLDNARWNAEKMAEFVVAVAQENHALIHTDIGELKQRLWETEETALALVDERNLLLRGLERLKYGYRITEDDHPDVQRAWLSAKASALQAIASTWASTIGLVPEDVYDVLRSILDGDCDYGTAVDLLCDLLSREGGVIWTR